jgi:hypothetical protein
MMMDSKHRQHNRGCRHPSKGRQMGRMAELLQWLRTKRLDAPGHTPALESVQGVELRGSCTPKQVRRSIVRFQGLVHTYKTE